MNPMQSERTFLEPPYRFDRIHNLQYGEFVWRNGKHESAMQSTLGIYQSSFAKALHDLRKVTHRDQSGTCNQRVCLWFGLIGKIDDRTQGVFRCLCNQLG